MRQQHAAATGEPLPGTPSEPPEAPLLGVLGQLPSGTGERGSAPATAAATADSDAEPSEPTMRYWIGMSPSGQPLAVSVGSWARHEPKTLSELAGAQPGRSDTVMWPVDERVWQAWAADTHRHRPDTCDTGCAWCASTLPSSS